MCVQGARLKELNEFVADVSEPTLRQLLEDVRDGACPSISLYDENISPDDFALLLEIV